MNTKNYPVFADTLYQKLTAVTSTAITDITEADSLRDMAINNITIVNLDETARTLKLYINNGTTDFQIATVSLAASAGNSTTVAALNCNTNTYTSHLFSLIDNNGNRTIPIPKGYKLRASIDAATSGVVINVVGYKFVQVS